MPPLVIVLFILSAVVCVRAYVDVTRPSWSDERAALPVGRKAGRLRRRSARAVEAISSDEIIELHYALDDLVDLRSAISHHR